MKRGGRTPLRDKSRGVAVLEFALAIVFLVPLVMGMLDFGYYFYVGTNAEEAARAGAREAALAGGVCPGGGVKAAGQQPAAGSGATCIGGAAACYMNQPPLNLGGAVSTMVLLICLNGGTVPVGPVDPTWQISVQVDFPLAYGFFRPLFPPGATSDLVRYTATVTTSP